MCGRSQGTSDIRSLVSVPNGDTLGDCRTRRIQTAEAIYRVIGEVAIGLYTILIRVVINETVHLLTLHRKVFRRVPQGGVGGVGQNQRRIVLIVRSYREVFVAIATLLNPHALYRTGIILVIQSFSRRTPQRTSNPHSLITRLIIHAQRITTCSCSICTQVITLAVINRGERGIRIGRHSNNGVNDVSATDTFLTIYIRRCTCENQQVTNKNQPFAHG